MPAPDKARVLDLFERHLRDELDALARVTEAARDEATNAESRPENKYDTRALEASYLAAGQGERLAELGRLIAWVSHQDRATAHRCAGEGALVHVAIGGRARWILLAPRGGPELVVDGVPVQLISRSSPLGRALEGLADGDAAETESPRGPQDAEILAVR